MWRQCDGEAPVLVSRTTESGVPASDVAPPAVFEVPVLPMTDMLALLRTMEDLLVPHDSDRGGPEQWRR